MRHDARSRHPLSAPKRAVASTLVAALAAPLFIMASPAARVLVATAPGPDAAAAAAAGPASTAAWGARCIGPAFDDTPAFQAAIDTGHTVYAPALGGQCHITHALVMRTPGQIFHGDGRARTKIVIEPGFTGEGVFVAKTGEPGPVWRDFSVSFVQPDTDDRAKLTHYPPAFLARSTPRFEMDHVGCYVATACIDMKGNSGGATIADLQMSAFEVGIDIDGSLDTVRVTDPHWWPFAMSKAQQQIFFNQRKDRSIGISLGRADDFILRGGLFLGGLALDAHRGKSGVSTASIETTDFDSGSGLVVAAGDLHISTSELIMGLPGSQAVHLTGGTLSISNSQIGGPPSAEALILILGGNLTVNSNTFNTATNDVTAIEQDANSSLLIAVGNSFIRSPNNSFKKPTIRIKDGRFTLLSNVASDKGSGAGKFLEVLADNVLNRVVSNVTPGWPELRPRLSKGIYLFN